MTRVADTTDSHPHWFHCPHFFLFSYPDLIPPYPLPNDECTYKYFFRHLCCHSFIIGRHVPLYHVSVRHVSDEIDPITETESLQRQTSPAPPRELQSSKVNIDTVLSPLSLSLARSPIKY